MHGIVIPILTKIQVTVFWLDTAALLSVTPFVLVYNITKATIHADIDQSVGCVL